MLLWILNVQCPLLQILRRQIGLHDELLRMVNSSGVVPMKYLRTHDFEVDLHDTYGGVNGKGQYDCTHHIYTPLYFDAMFERLADVISEPMPEVDKIRFRWPPRHQKQVHNSVFVHSLTPDSSETSA